MQVRDTPLMLACGIGYREPHRREMQALRPAVGFLEVHAENFMSRADTWADLVRARRDWPVSVHAVGLSLGSVERPDEAHLGRLAEIVDAIDPMLVSEHLSFCRVGDDYLNDLLPLPMTPLALDVVCRNVEIVQQRIGRRILIENPSRYLSYRSSSIPEPEFLNELARRTGCGLLLDLNNVHVTCVNVDDDADAWCDSLDLSAVGQIHLAGHARVEVGDGTLLVDDHGSAVSAAVWRLFDRVIGAVPTTPVLIEWDNDIPPLETLVAQASIADARRARLVTGQRERAARGADLAFAS